MRGRSWVIIAALVVVDASGCTKRNPAVCCSTAPECEEIGFDEITPCEGLKVCVEGSCESPTCTTSAECTEPAPYCVNMICGATCTADPDCVGVPGRPHCAPEGACVACVESAQCTDPAAAVCDEGSHECRPCGEDSECASGVCLATEGTCSAETDVVYVATGGSDSGECLSSNPCRTIQFGLTKVTAQRRVLRLVDSDFLIPDGVTIDRDVYIDTAATRFQRSSPGPIMTVENAATVTIEGARVENPNSVPALVVRAQAEVVISELDLMLGGANALVVEDLNSFLRLTRSRLYGATVNCGARIEVDSSLFENTASISGSFCTAAIHHNRFEGSRAVATSQSQVVMQNNLITVGSSGVSEVNVLVSTARVGTLLRFNTFVSTASGTGSAILCGGAGIVSSNIFAWQSPNAVSASNACEIRNSLFDSAAGTITGSDNITGIAFAEIFAAADDFHPASTSPAKESAEAAPDVTDDLDHGGRPLPAGTTPDIGCYDVP